MFLVNFDNWVLGVVKNRYGMSEHFGKLKKTTFIKGFNKQIKFLLRGL